MQIKNINPLWLLFTCTQTILSWAQNEARELRKPLTLTVWGFSNPAYFCICFTAIMGTIKDQRSKFVRKCQNNVDHNGGRLPAVAALEPDGIIHILFPLGLWGSQVDSYLESLSLPMLPSWLAFIMKPSQIFPTFSFPVCNNGRLKIVQQLFYSTNDVTSAHNGTRMKSSFLLFCQINKTIGVKYSKQIWYISSRLDFDRLTLMPPFSGCREWTWYENDVNGGHRMWNLSTIDDKNRSPVIATLPGMLEWSLSSLQAHFTWKRSM